MPITVPVTIPDELAVALRDGKAQLVINSPITGPLISAALEALAKGLQAGSTETRATQLAAASELPALKTAVKTSGVSFTLTIEDRTENDFSDFTVNVFLKTTARQLVETVEQVTGVEPLRQMLRTPCCGMWNTIWNGYFQGDEEGADRPIFKVR